MSINHVIKSFKQFFSIGKLRNQLAIDNYKNILENDLIRCTESGITNERCCNHEVIVSLTSYNKRLPIVYLSIASIMRQTLKPNRIILWLSEDLKDTRLPSSLELLKKRGLEIRYCEDIRSYKKLIPTLRLFPDAVIITIDDDVMYDIGLIDRLVSAHIEDPHAIWGSRISRIIKTRAGDLKPYKKWSLTTIPYEDSPYNIATGVGGILYPPGCFNDEIFNEQKFMTLAPTADDLWFKAMAIASNTPVKRILSKSKFGEDYLGGIVSFTDGLAAENIVAGGNDKTIANLHEYFDKLKG